LLLFFVVVVVGWSKAKFDTCYSNWPK